MTIPQHEQAVLKASSKLIQLDATDHDCLLIHADHHSHVLIEESKDLDFNAHHGVVKSFGLGPGMGVIDVGAYVGDSAIAYLRAGCQVFAFEPFLDAFLCLLYNTRTFGGMIRCYNVIVGDGSTVKLDHRYEGNDCGCRFVEPDPKGLQSIRLDDAGFPCGIDFLKIDVEGFEMSVLEGARGLIKAERPMMHIESFPDALSRNGKTPAMLHALIESLGYEIFDTHQNRMTDTSYKTTRDLICFTHEPALLRH